MTRTKDYAQFIAEAAVPAAPVPVEVPDFLRAAGPTLPETARGANVSLQDWKEGRTAGWPVQVTPPKSALPTDDKSRKALPILTYITEYFPDALVEETRVAVVGNDQHNPGQPLHWAREKSKDQLNTAFRHMLDHKLGNLKDTDGTYHLAKAIWRLKAELQLTIERERNHGK